MQFLKWNNRIPDNVYIIEKESDFPVQDSTTITLQTWVYTLNAVIVTSKRFILPDWAVVQLRGTDAFIWGIIYTWTWNMYTFSDILSISFTETFMSCPLWTLYNVTNASLSLAQVFTINTAIFDCASMWSIEKVTQYTWYFNAFTDIGDWIILDGVDIISLSQCNIDLRKNNTTSMFSVDWTTTSFNLTSITCSTNSNESFLDFKSTLSLSNGTIVWCTYDLWSSWNLFAVWSKDETDVRLTFDANANMPKSIVFWNMNIASTETVTISSSWTPVLVNDTNTWGTNIWTELWDTSRFTFISSQWRFTYTWLEDVNVQVIVSSSIEKSSWWSDFISTIIMKNGSAISESKSWSDNNNPTNVVSVCNVGIVTWDYIELAVQNDDTSWNIDINISNFIIKD
jgi:hypothetical protein